MKYWLRFLIAVIISIICAWGAVFPMTASFKVRILTFCILSLINVIEFFKLFAVKDFKALFYTHEKTPVWMEFFGCGFLVFWNFILSPDRQLAVLPCAFWIITNSICYGTSLFLLIQVIRAVKKRLGTA